MEVDELSAILSGKKITEVTTEATPDQANIRYKDGNTIGVGDADDNGAIIVKFSDGSFLHIWSSEWGGIAYGREM